MTTPAHYLLVALPEMYALIDALSADVTLPRIDAEALASVLIDTFEKQPGNVRRIEDTLTWLVERGGLSEAAVFTPGIKTQLRGKFYPVLISIETALTELNPYENGRLAWRYIERRGKDVALFGPPFAVG